jgi:undecaprenyl-diphosphatase
MENDLFLYLNTKFHHPILDTIMWCISDFRYWIPLFLYWLFLLYQNQKKTFIRNVLLIVLIITLSDQCSSAIIKPYFKRLRPSHEPIFADKVHLIEERAGVLYRGGKYGFVSSHAANSFAIITFLFLILKPQFSFFWFFWAFLVSYSRIYLGVHYPTDILFGALVGIIIAFLVFYINLITQKKFKKI